ncbi:hypothetical protein, partial [Niastella populi]|uniref:hypothetical protein n=1 Tax=Niastella populi TaxID=550983 RepID=UPI001A98BBF6
YLPASPWAFFFRLSAVFCIYLQLAACGLQRAAVFCICLQLAACSVQLYSVFACSLQLYLYLL